MASLHSYIRESIKLAGIALLAAGIVYLLVKTVNRRKGRNYSPAIASVDSWYLFTLIMVLFFSRTASAHEPMSSYNLNPLTIVYEILIPSNKQPILQLIINILIFMPLGFLLFWTFKSKKKRKICLALLVAAPLICELIQFFTGLGTFDVDDLILNLLGEFWGLGLWLTIERRHNKKKIFHCLILMAIPIVIAVILSGLYVKRPYGFIPEDFNRKNNKPLNVDCSKLEMLPDQHLPLYAVDSLEIKTARDEAMQKIESIFALFGYERNTKLLDNDDDDMITRYVADGDAALEYHFDGRFYFNAPHGLEISAEPFASLMDLQNPDAFAAALIQGLGLPDISGYEINMPGEGELQIKAEFLPMGENLLDGTINVKIKDGLLYHIYYNMLKLSPANAGYPSLSLEEVQREIEKGHFSLLERETPAEIKTIDCLHISRLYEIDGKGFYHPVFKIECMIDAIKSNILVPAI